MSEEKIACPKCGTLISKGDRFCRNCGATFAEASVTEKPVVPEQKIEPPYQRKFSMIQRFYKLLFSPSEAMEDIALAPDYEGVVVVITIELVLSIFSLIAAFQKIHFVGAYAESILGFVYVFLILGVILGVGLIAVRWLLKSYIVKYACDSGSSWNFKTAASVTGYAYLATIIISLISMCVSWFLVPSFIVDTSNLEAAIQTMNEYRAQISWIGLLYSFPVSVIGLIWKSYLGGLGAHFGTRKKCSLGLGMAVFFIVGLIGLLISFAGLL